ncbi:MAG TPA: antibiotic biosynthesis monooxygenase family protein [Bacteroidota bacterium]|jgi:heme-degrading monooxygenase HmoA|nr:antibiotic biosynthesis monooxygenase family protein [Bacteroidota bacterium]
MFIRLVQMNVIPEKVGDVRSRYEERVIPVLQGTKGCLYASLVQSSNHPGEYISLTLWESPADAEAYERSGVFKKLWEEGKEFLAGSSEWKIKLSDDFTLMYEPEIADDPVVTGYEVRGSHDSPLANGSLNSLYVRIVSPQIQKGLEAEFRKIYVSEILPEIRKTQGCRYAYVTENLKDSHQIISLTVWDSKEAAEEYENSGPFKELVKKVEHTFSEMHQWKMQLAKETVSRIVTSEELTVDGYSVVTGKSFL